MLNLRLSENMWMKNKSCGNGVQMDEWLLSLSHTHMLYFSFPKNLKLLNNCILYILFVYTYYSQVEFVIFLIASQVEFIKSNIFDYISQNTV